MHEYHYFLHNIQTNLGDIIRDLRHKHTVEAETAPTTSVVEYLKREIEFAQNIKGTPIEKKSALLCKRNGINYAKVPYNEKATVIRFLQRSKNYRKNIRK